MGGPAPLFWGPPDPSLLPHDVWTSSGLLGAFKPFTTLGVQMGATELYRDCKEREKVTGFKAHFATCQAQPAQASPGEGGAGALLPVVVL